MCFLSSDLEDWVYAGLLTPFVSCSCVMHRMVVSDFVHVKSCWLFKSSKLLIYQVKLDATCEICKSLDLFL